MYVRLGIPGTYQILQNILIHYHYHYCYLILMLPKYLDGHHEVCFIHKFISWDKALYIDS
jgi:hypothetical protein